METSRCILATLVMEDFEDVAKLYRNDEVRKYLGGAIPKEHTWAKFKDTLNRSKADALFWAVRLKTNNEFIGLVSLDKHVDGGTEISYEFLPAWWGAGYATEVIRQVLLFAFDELNLVELVAETQTANVSSCRLLERVGMNWVKNVQRYGAEQAIYTVFPRDDLECNEPETP